MIPTHLSIDLDYWSETPYPIRPKTFFEYIFAINVPIIVYMLHQEVVPQINRSGCVRLINMDYHSDWGYGSPKYKIEHLDQSFTTKNGIPLPDEGDWVDHISWRINGEFIWLPPSLTNCVIRGYGRCDSEPFGKYYPWPPQKAMNEYNEWQTVRYCLDPWKDINWAGVTDISIVISPDYIDPTPLINDGIFDKLGISFDPKAFEKCEDDMGFKIIL